MNETPFDIKEKMAKIVAKWKDKVPEKLTTDWWRYRADQIYYRVLKKKLR